MVDELLFSCFVCSYRTGPAVSGFVYNVVVVFCFPSSLTGLDPGTVATLLGGTFVFLVESLPGLDPLHLFAKLVGQAPRLVLPDWTCTSWCKLVKCWLTQSYITEITLSPLNAQNLA